MNIEGLIEFLERNADSRGVMADLRRGLSPATEHRAWRHIARFCDLTRPRERAIAVTVAGGYAVTGESRGGKYHCLGHTLRQIAMAREGQSGLESFDARFRRLLACHTAEEACERLPAVFRAAKQRGVPIDFRRLARHLTSWHTHGEEVKTRWAKAYWGSEENDGRTDGDADGPAAESPGEVTA